MIERVEVILIRVVAWVAALSVLPTLCVIAILTCYREAGLQPDTFGPVEVRAYTANDPGNRWADGRTATNKLILQSDYSVAVSPDIEEWLGSISNNKAIHIPGYNRPGEWSAINDRSDLPARSVEVLMTAGDARKRAMQWGVKRGILKGVNAQAGWVYWIEMESE